MARVTISPQILKGPYPGPVSAGDLHFTFTAADVANKNQFKSTGREVLVIKNSHGANPYTVTITSVQDSFHRTGDITTYSLAAGEHAVFNFRDTAGWMQADGYVYFEASNAAILFAVLQFP